MMLGIMLLYAKPLGSLNTYVDGEKVTTSMSPNGIAFLETTFGLVPWFYRPRCHLA
jgi:hypothetical protein